MSKYKPYIISLLLTFAVAVLGGIVTYKGRENYMQLIQPPLSPPEWLFPVVWSVLFILMAVGAARVYIKGGDVISKEIIIYAVQLIFNFLWCVFFFGIGAYLFAFVWLLALIGLVFAMTVLFYRVDKPSGLMQIPYLLWLCFAAYLNIAVYLLNY